VLGGNLHVMGGSSGNVASRALHNDTWAWTGSLWIQKSASAPWPARDWHGTARYDGKLWALTGATPSNNGAAYWSADGGATWTGPVTVPWGGSHADAVTATEVDGITIASGNGHGTNTYRLQRAP